MSIIIIIITICFYSVFGFSETSFTAEEQGESYSFEVGYIKGASAGSPVHNVGIEAEGITAGQQRGSKAPIIILLIVCFPLYS